MHEHAVFSAVGRLKFVDSKKSSSYALRMKQACWGYVLFFVMSFFTAPAFAAVSSCDFLVSSAELQKVLSSLQSELQEPPPWNNYRLSQNPVVFLKLNKSSKCAVLVREGKVVNTFESAKDLKLSNNAYAFLIDGRSLGGDELGDIPSALANQGIAKAMIWNVDFAWPSGVPQGLEFGIMMHEGFHLFAQKGNESSWPQWSTNQGQLASVTIRQELIQKCYNGSAKISALADQEFQHLINANRAALAGHQDVARLNMQDFVKARALRYQLLKNVKIKLNQHAEISCEDLEASFEFEEGIPEYVSYATVLNLKHLNWQDLETFIKGHYRPSLKSEAYYTLGGLQLLALSMLSADFSHTQKNLLNSTGAAEGLFAKTSEGFK